MFTLRITMLLPETINDFLGDSELYLLSFARALKEPSNNLVFKIKKEKEKLRFRLKGTANASS